MKLEAVKPLILVAAFIICIFLEHLPFGAAILLSLVHFGSLAICGEIVRRLVGLPAYSSLFDKAVLNYLLGWCLVPVLALIAFICGSIGVTIGIFIALFGTVGLVLRRKCPEKSLDVSDGIPISLYIVAGVFTIVSVAVPFSCFSSTSILREFYGDAVQRFGVIYSLSNNVPPKNPFFAGAHLRYYWLWMIPYAAEFKYICSDLFSVWKCGQTWTALCFPLGLWCLLRQLLNNRKAAYIAILLALIFTSFEIFAHPVLLQKAAGLVGFHYTLPASAKNIVDPDFTIGVLQPYSDQILTEDFLYIPQNTYAIIIVLVSIVAMAAGRVGTGALVLSALAGINPFFAIPAYAAYLLTCLLLYGFKRGLNALCILIASSSIWMGICGIIAPRQAIIMIGIFALPGCISTIRRNTLTKQNISGKATQIWAIAMLISFACIIALSPIHNAAAIVLAYSPSILFGIYYLVHLARKRTIESIQPLIIFLLVFCTVFALTTVFISFQQIGAAPEWLQNAAIQTGKEINLFNFYHKSGKMVRVAWAVFGAMGMITLLPYLQQLAEKRRYLVIVGTAYLMLTAITTIVRPFTYLGNIPVAESDAAAYLKKTSANEIVLVEDYKNSEINELVPVQVFYYSQWSTGNSGLNTLSGTWADQYLPAHSKFLSLRRVQQVKDFFTPTTYTNRLRFLKSNDISFILTRQPYDFEGIASLVVDKPGGYLYRVQR